MTNTSGTTESGGLVTNEPIEEEEIEPSAPHTAKAKPTVRAKEYIPQTMQESLDDRASKSQVETDRVARCILVGCLILIGTSHVAQLVAGWISSPVSLDGANATLDTIKSVATIIMGYLFGKNALRARDK